MTKPATPLGVTQAEAFDQVVLAEARLCLTAAQDLLRLEAMALVQIVPGAGRDDVTGGGPISGPTDQDDDADFENLPI